MKRHIAVTAPLNQAMRFAEKTATARTLLIFTIVMLALHWLRPWADRDIHFGILAGQNWATDLCTDEGWEANAAIRAVLLGNWHAPGEMNVAVVAPAWPAILYLPFKYLGVSIAVARIVSTTLFIISVLAVYFFVRRLSNPRVAALTTALLSASTLGFTFGRVAFVEPVFVSFAIVALLLTLYAADSGLDFLMIVAGFVLYIVVLVKLTAVFVIVPMVAIVWLRAGSSKIRLRFIGIMVIAAGGVILTRHLMVKFYPNDVRLYMQMNLGLRQVHSLKQWLVAFARIVYGLRVVGLFLLAAFVAGAALILSGRRRTDPLIIIGAIWFVANLLIFTPVNYFPPRYCFSLLFPLTLLAVRSVSLLDPDRVVARGALCALLGLALVTSSAHDLISLAHPRYTMLNFAKQIQASLPEQARKECPIVGSFANTLSLYTGFPSATEGPNWGVQPLYERIESCNPRVFVTNPEVSPDAEAVDSFDRMGKRLKLKEQVRLFDYSKPVSLYAVEQK